MPQLNLVSAKARTIPYSLKGKIEQELDRLVKQGVIEPITFSEWAAPIIPALKKDSTVRICGDYKLSVNQASKVDSYPLPKIDDLFASLAGGKTFSKLDIPYKANHSRGKTFAVGCRIHNSLENICGKVVCRLTPIKFILWGAHVAP